METSQDLLHGDGVSGQSLLFRQLQNQAPFAGLSDTITLREWFNADNRIETFRFDDGSSLDVAGIISRVGTDEADTLSWTETVVSLDAGAGDDVITSGAFDDTLAGGEGNDTLSGGAGDDLFVFGDGDGADIINGFTTGAASDDVIDLIGVSGLSGFTDVQNAATQLGADTLIDFGGGDQITLVGVDVNTLNPDDFLI